MILFSCGSDVFSVASVYSVGDYGEEEERFLFSPSRATILLVLLLWTGRILVASYLSGDNFRLTGVINPLGLSNLDLLRFHMTLRLLMCPN